MKRINLILAILCLILACSAVRGVQKVVVHRDPFSQGRWDICIPADSEGKYWTMYDVGFADWSGTYRPYLSLNQIVYGPCRPGKIFIAYGGAWGTETGTWTNQATAQGEAKCTYRQNAADGTGGGQYVLVAIPAGYNEIHVFYYNVSGSASNLAFAWSDSSTTGLDITSFTGGGFTAIEEIVIATNAAPDGVKTLKISKTSNTDKTARILGVRCWNTHEFGTMFTETSAGSGLAMGHGIVTEANGISARMFSHYATAGDPQVKVITSPTSTGSSIEFAVKWAQTGDTTTRWTGSNIHEVDWRLLKAAAATLNGDGTVTIELASAHGLSTGARVRFSGTTSYDGDYAITVVNSTKIKITHSEDAETFDGDEKAFFTCYPYIMDAAYATNGPEIIVDGISKGLVFDNATGQAQNYIAEAEQVSIRSSGYASAGVMTPDMEMAYNFDKAGFSMMTSIAWDGDVTFDAHPNEAMYSMMLPFNSSVISTGSYVVQRPDTTKTDFAAGTAITTATLPASSSLDIYLNDGPLIKLTNNCPSDGWKYIAGSTYKFYSVIRPEAMAGGTTPASGDKWLIAGHIEVKRVKPITDYGITARTWHKIGTSTWFVEN